MAKPLRVDEVLEAVDQLSPDEQETLMEVMHHRLVEQRCKRLTTEAHEAQREFAEGACQPTSADDLMREILERGGDFFVQVPLSGQRDVASHDCEQK